MTPLRGLAALLSLSLLGSALAGCDPPKTGGGGNTPAPSGGSVLRLAQLAEPTTLDPGQVQDGPTIEFLMHVFNGLVQWTPQSKIAPALAEKWEITNGGRTYVFHLRSGVKFHNGRELAAEDVVYSLTRSVDPKLAAPVALVYLGDIVGAKEFRDGKAQSVKGLEAPDPKTVKITIDQPKAYFLSKLTYPTGYVVCKEAIEAEGGVINEKSMIGTGSFKLAEYRRGDRIVLDANPDFFEGAPKLARVERRILLDVGTRHDKFEAGELDIADISMAMYRADKNNPQLAPLIHQFQRPSIFYMALNQRSFPPFKDKRVRHAFAHAVNKEEIVRTVHEGVVPQAHGIIPPGVPGFREDFQGLPYDPEKAKKLLAEAGYPNGQGFPPLKLAFRASVEDIKNTCVAIAADLEKNLGIKVDLDETEWATFLKKRNTGEMPFYFLRWAADYLDPQNFLSTMLTTGSPENTLGYSNPEFDRLCWAADLMQDPAKRMATYHKAEELVIDDAPWVPIYYQKEVELWNPRLRGVEDSAMGHLPHVRTYFADK
jgi:oligopeptide transport system substrate-binding protein